MSLQTLHTVTIFYRKLVSNRTHIQFRAASVVDIDFNIMLEKDKPGARMRSKSLEMRSESLEFEVKNEVKLMSEWRREPSGNGFELM